MTNHKIEREPVRVSVEFETHSTKMKPKYLVTVHAPAEDVDRIMLAVTAITPLAMGEKFDRNAYEFASGVERYRPLEGTHTGAELETRKRPGVVSFNFELPIDQALLERVVEAIFISHSYQEPLIRISEIVSCRSRGLDDSKNPNRWWNSTGDWKKTQ